MNSEWTTIRVSRKFRKWLESKGMYGESAFDVIARLIGWKDETDVNVNSVNVNSVNTEDDTDG